MLARTHTRTHTHTTSKQNNTKKQKKPIPLPIPRPLQKAKESIGAIARLVSSDGRAMTVNVEYNQLDPLLRATINPEGDVNDPKTGEEGMGY